MRLPNLAGVVALAVAGIACQPAGARRDATASRDIVLRPDAKTVESVVPANATFETLLATELPTGLTGPFVDSIKAVFNPRQLRAGETYRVVRTLDGIFREFQYEISADSLLRVVFRAPEGGFDATVEELPREYEIDAVSASISEENNSLVRAFGAFGENIQLPLQLAEIFGGEVDFNSDLQRGDRIDVLFDRAVRHGEFVGYGDVRAAVLEQGGRRITAFRFPGSDGKPQWYDEEGRSLRRQFLKSPLPFDPRVTSGFSTNRFHPVHGRNRPHLGVDYGAPYGTPVKAVASGVVELAAWSGEAGRMVRIRHTGGYQTAYLHLSSFGPGVRPGARVDQGQLIGRVGQTGTATGPHLDYRIIRNGVYVNPVTELSRMPPGEPLPSDAVSAFAAERDTLMGQLRERLDAAVPVNSSSNAN